MKIVVTGASSFLAVNFIALASKENYITAVVRPNSRNSEPLKKFTNVQILELEMSEYLNLGSIIGSADVLVHFAWNGTRGLERNVPAVQQENFFYSMDAIKSMVDVGCRKIVLSGSQAEYGNHNDLITEETECNPNTAYGIYKLKLYEEARWYCEAHSVCLIEPRYFSIYGPGDYAGTLVMSCLQKMLHNEPISLTECTQIWNYLYLDDAIRALYCLVVSNAEPGIYNVASDDNQRLKFFVEQMYQITRSSSELSFGAISYPKTGAVNLMASVTKLMLCTDWKPRIAFSEGIIKTIESMKVLYPSNC